MPSAAAVPTPANCHDRSGHQRTEALGVARRAFVRMRRESVSGILALRFAAASNCSANTNSLAAALRLTNSRTEAERLSDRVPLTANIKFSACASVNGRGSGQTLGSVASGLEDAWASIENFGWRNMRSAKTSV